MSDTSVLSGLGRQQRSGPRWYTPRTFAAVVVGGVSELPSEVAYLVESFGSEWTPESHSEAAA